jgi:hypothetical protein
MGLGESTIAAARPAALTRDHLVALPAPGDSRFTARPEITVQFDTSLVDAVERDCNQGHQHVQTDRHDETRVVGEHRRSVGAGPDVHTAAEPPGVMLQPMNTLWIVGGIGVIAAVMAIVRWYGRGRETDLGFVSQQWVAENRLSQQHEPPR